MTLSRARRQLAVSLLPAALAVVALAVPGPGGDGALAASFSADPLPAVLLAASFLLCLALGSLHRPLGGSSLGLGTAALPGALLVLGVDGAALLAAGGYALGGLGRRLLRRLAPEAPEERRGLGRLAEGAGRSALATVAAGLAWRALEPAPGPDAATALSAPVAAGSGIAYVAVFAVLVLGAEKLRRPNLPLRLFRFAPPFLLDVAGWGAGATLAAVGAGAGWGPAAALLWALAFLVLEAARLDALQGVFERRAVDLARVSRASRRMASAGFGLAGLAAQVRAECLRVLEVRWFQLEVYDEAAGPGESPAGRPEGGPGGERPPTGGRVRSWWAGPDGVIHGGVPDPGPAPPPLPGIHRRQPWRVVERELEDAGRRLARLRLWCDPRRVRPGELEVLESLLPQLAGWVHRALLDREAREDPLTGVLTRRHLERSLAEAFARVWEGGGRLAAVLVDLDHFKRINDTHGHAAGDRALVAVARTLEAHRRSEDVCARYGGEEFALVLDGADGETALAVAERLRRAVATLVVEEEGRSVPLTASVGVAAFPELWASAPGELLALADEALYAAKRIGRDRALLNLGRGRFREPGGAEIGGDDDEGPVEAPRIFA